MSIKTKVHFLSADEYLEGEQHSEVKHELVDGQAYAMVGTSKRHNTLSLALAAQLLRHVKGSPCRVFMSDVKVRVGDDFYYPDVLVSCMAGGHDYYETAPVLIVEVLSPTTEARDRLEKRLAYQRLPSLKEYVLIAQDAMRIEIYRRTEDGWEVERCSEHDVLHLESVDFTVPLVEIYRDVME